MSRCPCLNKLEKDMVATHGDASVSHGSVTIRHRAPLRRPVKEWNGVQGWHRRIHTWKDVCLTPKFCMLCGKPWPKRR